MPTPGPSNSSTEAPSKQGFAVPWSALVLLVLLALMGRFHPLFPTPLELLQSFRDVLGDPESYRILGRSFGRVLVGYFLASFLGIGLAEITRHRPEILDLPIRLLRAIPVAVLTLFLLFFMSPRSLSLFIPLAVVLPLTYTQAQAAIEAMPQASLDLLRIYPIPWLKRLRFFVLPQRLPYWETAQTQSFGLAVKSAVAAEILTLPHGSLGEAFYDAKLYLEMDRLLVWTILLLLLTNFVEKLLTFITQRIEECLRSSALIRYWPREPQMLRPLNSYDQGPLIVAKDLSFDYGETRIFGPVSFQLERGCYRLKGGTGAGKSSLLRLLLGLEKEVDGHLELPSDFQWSVAFQDGHFLPGLSALNQLRAVSFLDREEALSRGLLYGLRHDDLMKDPEELSGGMRKQLGLARALARPCHGLILDEAFTGLDPTLKARLEERVREEQRPQVLIYVTHQPDVGELRRSALYLDFEMSEHMTFA